MPQHVALYASVSSARQVEEGTIDAQRASLQTDSTAHGSSIDAAMIFLDDGFRGATLARPRWDALRDRAMLGTLDEVLVLAPDRFARNQAHQLVRVEALQRLGVEIVFINRPLAHSPEDHLLLQMQGVIAAFERAQLLERSRRGKLHKAKQGQGSVCAGAPYGYGSLAGGAPGQARYAIHPQEADIVRRIFQLYVEEGLSMEAIARDLTAQQIPTRHEAPQWHRSVVWGMLRHPAYQGQAAYRKTQAVARNRPTKAAHDQRYYPKGVHASTRQRPQTAWLFLSVPPISSPRLFARAGRQLEAHKRQASRNNKRYEDVLRGRLRCQRCGYALYGKPVAAPTNPRRDYRCRGQDGHRWAQGRVCAGHPMRVEVGDESGWEHTQEFIQHPEVILQEYRRRVQTKKQGELDLTALLMKKQKEIH